MEEVLICADASYTLCTAPSCAECDDFAGCFGEETGESLLARAHCAADASQWVMELRLQELALCSLEPAPTLVRVKALGCRRARQARRQKVLMLGL